MKDATVIALALLAGCSSETSPAPRPAVEREANELLRRIDELERRAEPPIGDLLRAYYEAAGHPSIVGTTDEQRILARGLSLAESALSGSETTQRLARRVLGVFRFRCRMYPLALEALEEIADDPKAREIRALLKSWSQDTFRVRTQIAGKKGVSFSTYECDNPAPASPLLHAKYTFVARERGRTGFTFYSLSSQWLEDRRVYYLMLHCGNVSQVLKVYEGAELALEDAWADLREYVASLLDSGSTNS